MKTGLLILSILAISHFSFATETGFARYQIIIDKRPFGEEPAEPEVVQVDISKSFAKSLRLTMLFQGPNGDVRAGIVDSDRNKSYILRIGEMEDELELVEANLEGAEATLRRNNETALLKMKEGVSSPSRSKDSKSKSKTSTYASRRAKKEKKEPAEPRLTGEELKLHLREVQMNAIREGLPPLPMALTPEMDAQLVSEGVLDPQQ